MNQRGFIDIIFIVTVAIVASIFIGGAVAIFTVKCDPAVQHCIDYPGGSVEAPK